MEQSVQRGLEAEGKVRRAASVSFWLYSFINMMRIFSWYFCALLAVLTSRSWRADAFATSASSSGASSASSSSSAPSSPNENAGCNNNDQPRQIFGIEASWSSPDWNWGSPFGLGHDCAMKCRQRFATEDQRRELVNSLVHADTDTQVLSNFEDVKLVLALAWQRGRNFDPDLEAFGQILDQMADLRYENGDDGEGNMEGDRLLVQDLQKKYMWLHPEVEDKIQMNMLLYDHHDDDFDIVRRKAAGLVLKSMDFDVEGL